MSCKVKSSAGKWTVLLSFAILAVLVSLSGQAFGQAKVGTAGAKFLDIGISARAMGMSEAYSAIANDISAVYYNPAGLTQIYSREAMFTHIDYPADINYEFAAVAFPWEAASGVIAFSFYNLRPGEIPLTTYANPEGTGEMFFANDYAITITYARSLTEHFSLGTTFKAIGQYYDNESATGWAADVGTIYDTGYRGFKIAMSIMNFGPDMKMITQEYPLPINFKFGSSFNFIESPDHLATFALEGAHPSDNLEQYNAGIEYWFHDKFSLRVGNRFNYDTDGFTAGAGMKMPFGETVEMRIDYSYQDFGFLREVHRFSLAMAF
ncbi:MAG: PorV/PorQ family protein [candidate division Zixibacteria bacterium]|nr:PorV/PorQ family protein [candidate division Zixibacteria bacterium]